MRMWSTISTEMEAIEVVSVMPTRAINDQQVQAEELLWASPRLIGGFLLAFRSQLQLQLQLQLQIARPPE